MNDTNSPENPKLNRDERISLLAYQIWEEEGRPDGRDEVHWYLACQMVDAEDGAETEPLPEWLNRQEQAPAPATAEVQPLKKKSAA